MTPTREKDEALIERAMRAIAANIRLYRDEELVLVTALSQAREREEKLTANLNASVLHASDIARALGEAEGKLRASEMVGIVDGWKDRLARAEASVAERDATIERLTRELADAHTAVELWMLGAKEACDDAEAAASALSTIRERLLSDEGVERVRAHLQTGLAREWGGYVFLHPELVRATIADALDRAIASHETPSLTDNPACVSQAGAEPAPSPAAVAAGWRPISTAPKDGTPVLAWLVRNSNNGPHVNPPHRIVAFKKGAWRQLPLHPVNTISRSIAWQPLPAAPQPEEA